MNNETFEKIGKIIIVCFSLNLIALIATFFYFSKNTTLLLLFVNVILLGSASILKKYWVLFDSLTVTNKFAKKLNQGLRRIENGQIS